MHKRIINFIVPKKHLVGFEKHYFLCFVYITFICKSHFFSVSLVSVVLYHVFILFLVIETYFCL